MLAQAGRYWIFISIHALREEGDSRSQTIGTHTANFYPRPPRGGRQQRQLVLSVLMVFLSTPSARRATGKDALKKLNDYLFLSTPSARRATTRSRGQTSRKSDFYPRPPRGGRRN